LRVLVTNDDGIESPGLSALAGVARQRGHDTIVVAPNWDSSGASAAVTGVTQGRDLLVERHNWPGWGPGAVLSVNATPALICRSAFHGAFGRPPEIVLSGINRGANTGRAILHSGTVGAAFTAYLERRPALAVSLAVAEPADGHGAHWATAAMVAGRLFDWLAGEMRHVVLNCNVPNVPTDHLRGIRVGRLAAVGTSQTTVTERTGELLPLTVGAASESTEPAGETPRPTSSARAPGVPGGAPPPGAPPPGAPPPGAPPPGAPTDAALLQDGYASVTAVVPILEESLELPIALRPGGLGR
jgi:5'-nucleotidase